MDDLTIQSWNSSSSAWVTELVETFTVNSTTGLSDNPLSYDNNGILLYDGTEAFTYDAWNRLTKVAHGYYDGSAVQSGQTFATIGYDGSGRRIMKAISNTGTDELSIVCCQR